MMIMKWDALRVLSLAIGFAVAGTFSIAGAYANTTIQVNGKHANATQALHVGLNKSIILELPYDARDVMVSNPAIVDAVVRTSRRVFLIGASVGEANVFLFDGQGRQLAAFDIVVGRDFSGVEGRINALVPNGRFAVESFGEGAVLSGQARTLSDAKKAEDILRRYLGTKEAVVNQVSIASEQQVHLKVVIAEVKRTTLKQLGIDLDAALNTSGATQTTGFIAGSVLDTAFPVNSFLSQQTQSTLGWVNGASNDAVTATIQAMERNNLARILAEPTLTTVSGEAANFLVGGEFPIPVGVDSTSGLSIEFKEFGISLAFVPIVHSPERVSLRVKSEVSELTTEGAISVPLTTTATVTIPAISVRRAETSLELPSGGSMVMAGLIHENTRAAAEGLPGLKNLPVLGALFKSTDFLQEQTELVIIATPYLVKPQPRKKLTRPDKNLQFANNKNGVFLSHLNKVYAADGAKVEGRFNGRVGFILD